MPSISNEMRGKNYIIVTDLFGAVQGETEETNPLAFGKELAEWVRAKLEESGVNSLDLIPEDWGWCVILRYKPYVLWVGCKNTEREEVPSRSNGKPIKWSIMVGCDVFPWSRHFWSRKRCNDEMRKVENLLDVIWEANYPAISLCQTRSGECWDL